jgi:hypothetical protein
LVFSECSHLVVTLNLKFRKSESASGYAVGPFVATVVTLVTSFY